MSWLSGLWGLFLPNPPLKGDIFYLKYPISRQTTSIPYLRITPLNRVIFRNPWIFIMATPISYVSNRCETDRTHKQLSKTAVIYWSECHEARIFAERRVIAIAWQFDEVCSQLSRKCARKWRHCTVCANAQRVIRMSFSMTGEFSDLSGYLPPPHNETWNIFTSLSLFSPLAL